MNKLQIDTIPFLQSTISLFESPQPTSFHTIYYCLPSQFIKDLQDCISSYLSETSFMNSLSLPCPDSISSLYQEPLCISRRTVRSELVPGTDYCIISDALADNLRVLYKLYSSFKMPHLPKVGVLYFNGVLTYEQDLPTYQIKLIGVGIDSTELAVKLSPYTTIAETINFILYKIHVQGQFGSIQMYSSTSTTPLNPNSFLRSANSQFFTLKFNRKRRAKTVALLQVPEPRFKTMKTHRIASPVLRELWSCEPEEEL
ncbi:hypothetical protein ENUP19_0274G0035 [Entamoeba nuttalli]|uniref:Uncharacterized protein n=1 Tax=Entamoeba nuttalli TaxID=412467 RepID=A0ABQ0DT60_9EUKA